MGKLASLLIVARRHLDGAYMGVPATNRVAVSYRSPSGVVISTGRFSGGVSRSVLSPFYGSSDPLLSSPGSVCHSALFAITITTPLKGGLMGC